MTRLESFVAKQPIHWEEAGMAECKYFGRQKTLFVANTPMCPDCDSARVIPAIWPVPSPASDARAAKSEPPKSSMVEFQRGSAGDLQRDKILGRQLGLDRS